jgi:hypothetical protein
MHRFASQNRDAGIGLDVINDDWHLLPFGRLEFKGLIARSRALS